MTPPPTSDSPPGRAAKILAALRRAAVVVRDDALGLVPPGFSPDAWLRLLRLPNLLTVPGDVLAGFLLAPSATAGDWGQLFFLAIPSGLLLYSAGLVLNDLFGYAEDLLERPQRPLPSQQVSRESAAAVAILLAWFAAFAAAFFDALPVALPLILCIVLYDVGLKRLPFLGPILMGACRAGNLLLGVSAAHEGLSLSPAPLAGAIALGLYVALVAHLARNEARPDAKVSPRHVGFLLRMLIPLQSTLCLAAFHRFPANLLALALLPLLPLHRRLSQKYPPS